MKNLLCTTLAALVTLTFGTTALFAQTQKPQTEFVFNLYRTVLKGKADENVMVSPYGVQHVLDLIHFGAAGETRAEIEKVIGYTDSVKWESGTDGPLSTAAAVWTQQGHPFLPPFLQKAREDFGTSVEQADFAANAAEAVKRINDWCSEKTNGKIPKLFDELDPTTRLVLVGAIHFLADWHTPFEKRSTFDGDFTLQNGTKVKTKLMNRTGYMLYGENADTKAIALRYKNAGYAMLVLLPKNPADFAKWESELTLEKWGALRRAMRAERTEVWLPRFTVETTIPLNDILKQLGMPTAFAAGTADFSMLDGTKDLFIAEALQKTYVRVDETGTEAAAVTGGVMAVSAILVVEDPKVFHADRPFVYAIVKDDTILFMGRYVKPVAE